MYKSLFFYSARLYAFDSIYILLWDLMLTRGSLKNKAFNISMYPRSLYRDMAFNLHQLFFLMEKIQSDNNETLSIMSHNNLPGISEMKQVNVVFHSAYLFNKHPSGWSL